MRTKRYTLPLFTRLNRLWMRPIFRGIFHLLSQVQIIGKENIPPQGAYIVAINHLSIFDPPFVAAFWSTPLEALGAIEIWSKPGQSALVRLYGVIQVRRGEYDRQSLKQMLAALEAGRPLMIAPEGGRSHTPGLRRGRPGVAYIVHQTGLPVIPVGVVGSTDDFLAKALRAKRPRLEMRIGKPLHLPPITEKGAQKHTSLQRNADRIMLAIAELLPPEYRGVYANQNSDTLERA